PYEKMKIVANDVAEEVFRVYRTITHQDWVKLAAMESELTLDVRRASPAMLEHANMILARPASEKVLNHGLEKVFAESVLQMEREWPDKVDIILQAFRIGDLGIAAIPFEVFAETGLEIKANSPLKMTFTIELA